MVAPHAFPGVEPRGGRPGAELLVQFAAEGVDPGRTALGHVALGERRLAHGHLQVEGAAVDQVFPGRQFDIVGLDLLQHLGVEIQGPVGRYMGQAGRIAAVGVAAAQVVMQPGQLETPFEVIVLGIEA